MEHLRVIFTRRFHPVSLLIRWALPRTRLAWAASSHGIVVDGEHAIEAHMIYGVRRLPLIEALKGATVVRIVDYPVQNAEAGLTWFRSHLCTYTPVLPRWLPQALHGVVGTAMLMLHNNYDYKGALGLGITPEREWQDPSRLFCFEGIAGAIKEAGMDIFADTGHITEATLLAVRHKIVSPLRNS